MFEIPLATGEKTLVDECVYKWLGEYNWSCNSGKYPVRGISGGKEKIWMHRLIAGYPFYYKVEYRNGKTFDLRISNLRVIAPDGKTVEWHGKNDGTSEFTGVVWDRRRGLWKTDVAGMAAGYWDNEIDAARAYNAKMVLIYGDNPDGLNTIPTLPPTEQTSWPYKRKDFKTSGYAGIYQNAHAKYESEIMVNGVKHRLGKHDTEDAAKAILDEAKGELGRGN